ncbi:hypothetical protein FSP39_020483 [Pinctada imbricata]|uniref:Uncharacterized protein n=1 Tax=Pinctada imbricata TaxID=66713 RepID=A0AA88XW74_PINIB|nr:hypothetical protein FSP39_020483 [Pinctada imbricata]
MSHVGSDVGVRGSKEQEETGVPGEKPPAEAWVGDHLPSHIRPFAETEIRSRDLRDPRGKLKRRGPINLAITIRQSHTVFNLSDTKPSEDKHSDFYQVNMWHVRKKLIVGLLFTVSLLIITIFRKDYLVLRFDQISEENIRRTGDRQSAKQDIHQRDSPEPETNMRRDTISFENTEI